MAICEAAGPRLKVCFAPSRVVASTYGPKVCGTPCQMRMSAPMIESGSST